MKFNYYSETDSLYIEFLDQPSVDSQEISPGVVIDFDAGGKIVGIDIDHASQSISLSDLNFSGFPFKNLAA